MVALALEIDRNNGSHADNMRIGGLFGHSSGAGSHKGYGGDHGHKAFSHFGHKNGYGEFAGIEHKGDKEDGLKTENILARNLRQQFIFGVNSPWGMKQSNIFSQMMNKAFNALGIATQAQQAETMATLANVAKINDFTQPVVSEDATPQEIELAVIRVNPQLFAINPTTGEALASDELKQSCEVSIPAEAMSLCGGQGLPREVAILMFSANQELNLEPKPTFTANYGTPAPTMMQ